MPPITVPLHVPELAPGRWLQGPEVSLGFARGAVALVDFWEATCVNCLRTLPYVVEWHRRYGGRGLLVVGVHTPEFELSRDPAVVEASLYAVLAERGLRPVRALQRISAANLGSRDAELLEVPVGAAGLRIERVSYLASGRVVEFVRSLYRGDAYDFAAELQIPAEPEGHRE